MYTNFHGKSSIQEGGVEEIRGGRGERERVEREG
jgi:hypothetical protein